MNNSSYNKSKLVVPGYSAALSQMKTEVANELGVHLGPDATARQNGTVGGEITRRLVAMAQNQLSNR